MPPSACLVCSSPTATSLHFGARSCKACAAFFRRTVSMNMQYVCAATDIGASTSACNIHYHLRMICRHCRLIKCVKAGMRRELVQCKDDTNPPTPTERKRKRTFDDFMDTPILGATIIPKEEESWSDSACSPPEDEPHPAVPDSAGSSNAERASRFSPAVAVHVDPDRVIEHYRRSEMALADRRRVMYGKCTLFDLFDTREDCPFRRENLREFSLDKFIGLTKADLISIMDHTRDLFGFSDIKLKADRNLMYRYVICVDYVLGTALYTDRLGQEERIMVLPDAKFIPMDPMPCTGFEEDAIDKFPSKKEHEMHNRLFIPHYIRHYNEVVVPFVRHGFSFNEYVLLKALVVFHMAYGRVSNDCRTHCELHRNYLIAALHKVAEDEGLHDPAERVGSLILFMSSIVNFTSTMIGLYFKIKLFDLAEIDPLIMSMCSFKY